MSQPGMPMHRPSRVSLQPCEPGGIAGRASENLALLLPPSACCAHQTLCRHLTLGEQVLPNFSVALG